MQIADFHTVCFSSNYLPVIILRIDLDGYETWVYTLREKHGLRMSENKIENGM
jgi:hypothetical protein